MIGGFSPAAKVSFMPSASRVLPSDGSYDDYLAASPTNAISCGTAKALLKPVANLKDKECIARTDVPNHDEGEASTFHGSSESDYRLRRTFLHSPRKLNSVHAADLRLESQWFTGTVA